MAGWSERVEGDARLTGGRVARSTAGTLVLGAILAGIVAVNVGEPSAGDGPSCRAVAGPRRGPVVALAWAPDGSVLAASHWGPVASMVKASDGSSRPVDFGGKGPRFATAWRSGGRELAAWGLDGSVVARAIGPGPVAPEDSPWMGSACPGSSVRLFGASDRRTMGLPVAAVKANVLASSFDGKSAATGGADGYVRVWDVSRGLERLAFRATEGVNGDLVGVNSVAFAPDGRTLASASIGGVRVWDSATGAALARFGDDATGYGVVAFSPDGSKLAGASWNQPIRVWDVATGRELARMTGHDGRTLAMAWSPDGLGLASGGYDGAVKLWHIP